MIIISPPNFKMIPYQAYQAHQRKLYVALAR